MNPLKAHDWKTSSFSAGGQCVDVRTTADYVHVKHSGESAAQQSVFTHGEWAAFVAGMKAGEFG
jgi:hypothetical protein